MTGARELLEAEPQHDGWTPDREPFCRRCTERLERLSHIAAGHGTITEIREAVTMLDAVAQSGAPLGEKYAIDGLRVCPRCTPAKAFGLSDDDTLPLIAVVPFRNRGARRRALKALRRRG